jgi:hypothetical protein
LTEIFMWHLTLSSPVCRHVLRFHLQNYAKSYFRRHLL